MMPGADVGRIAGELRVAALDAVAPAEAVMRAIRSGDGMLSIGDTALELDRASDLWVVGAGKASRGMAAGVAEILEDRVSAGMIVTADGLGRPLDGIEVWEASHPVPDVRGMAAATEALRLVRGAGAGDLVLCLLSGGASALWTAPAAGLTLGDLREVTESLLRAGAPIEDLNTVRRHLSRIAGGGLARAAAPAKIATVAISDVLGGAPHAVGSGPATPDPTTYADAIEVLGRYEVRAPRRVRAHLQTGAAVLIEDTLKPGELPVEPTFHVAASIRDALAAAAEQAMRLGYRPTVVTDRLSGEAAAAGERVAREAMAARDTAGPRRILLWGGETTVTVRGSGRGGRNQEVALAAALALAGCPGIAILTFATDGVDGPTPAAGALVDGSTAALAHERGLDPVEALRENDSHSLLAAVDALVTTGPTGTNVNDLTAAILF